MVTDPDAKTKDSSTKSMSDEGSDGEYQQDVNSENMETDVEIRISVDHESCIRTNLMNYEASKNDHE